MLLKLQNLGVRKFCPPPRVRDESFEATNLGPKMRNYHSSRRRRLRRRRRHRRCCCR